MSQRTDGNRLVIEALSTSTVAMTPFDNADQEPWKLGISLQSQRLDSPVIVFWPYIDDISETSTSVCHAC
jgi:hypothetical protein